MKKQTTLDELQALWERGVERAVEYASRSEELAANDLNATMGMQLRSGIRGGLWSHSCNESCRCGCGTTVAPA